MTKALQATAEAFDNVGSAVRLQVRRIVSWKGESFIENRLEPVCCQLMRSHKTCKTRLLATQYVYASCPVLPSYSTSRRPCSTRNRLLCSHSRPCRRQSRPSRYIHRFHLCLLAAYLTSAQSEGITSRAETVLHATTAELDQLHTERCDDYRAFATALLDAQIDAHAAALSQLRAARSLLDNPTYAQLADTGPRVASKLEYARRRTTTEPSSLPIPNGTSARKSSNLWSLLGSS